MAFLSTFKIEKSNEVTLEKFYNTILKFRELALNEYNRFQSTHENQSSFKEAKLKTIDLTNIFNHLPQFETWKMIPKKKNFHVNTSEFINQMANIETLISALEFSISKYPDYILIQCSPTSTYDPNHPFDSDLLLNHPSKEEYICFELSDVISYNANGKLAKDLDTLHKRFASLGEKGRYYIFSNPSLFGDSKDFLYLKNSNSSKKAVIYKEDTQSRNHWNKKIKLVELPKTSSGEQTIGYEVFYTDPSENSKKIA